MRCVARTLTSQESRDHHSLDPGVLQCGNSGRALETWSVSLSCKLESSKNIMSFYAKNLVLVLIFV